MRQKSGGGGAAFETPSNAWLFNIGNNRATEISFIGRVYSFKIIRDGQVRMYLIPCVRESDNKAGFYDIASASQSAFLTLNTGSFDDVGGLIGGAINAPSLPPEYAALAYLESTGGVQYVDTGVHPSESLRFTMRYRFEDIVNFKWTEMSMGMIEKQEGESYSRFHFNVKRADFSTRRVADYVYLRRSGAKKEFDFRPNFGTAWYDLTIDARDSIAYFDADAPQVNTYNVADGNDGDPGATLPAAFQCPSNFPLDPESNSTFWLFMRNSKTEELKGYTRMCIASAELWDDATKVRDLVPCERLKDGAAGFYDLVQKEFLPCAGENADGFIKGERVGFVLKPVGNVFYAGEGTAHPTVMVRAVQGGRTLTEGTDYELVFENDMAPGQAKVTVRGLGDFNGQNLWTKYWVVPKLPKGYTALQSIRSTGEQYINLGCPASDTTEFSTRVFVENTFHPEKVIDDQYPTVLGVRKSSSPLVQYRITPKLEQYSSRWQAYFGDTKREDYGINKPLVDRDTEIVFRSKRLTFNGGFTADFKLSTFSTEDCNLYLFGFWDQVASGGAKLVHPIRMRMWGLRLWENSVLVRDLVPCQASDGTVGLYDLAATGAAKAFYSSDTAVGFEAGAPCPSVSASAGLVILFR